ncbi:hypothetical protein MLD38_036477 [Melastoma candidum]|uniref:Uncharacterized protein n=1 Tax=Melastoma candidum TaxID=119954 RepID=A0ACB9LK19_9MYRT|nr:hypothetical protein MLD38_036477 [Melastoma candidum]
MPLAASAIYFVNSAGMSSSIASTATTSEIMDFGYPQNLSPEIIKLYITPEGVRSTFLSKPTDKPVPNATLQVTGTVGWRREGLVYKKNEGFLDIVESVNLLMSSKGQDGEHLLSLFSFCRGIELLRVLIFHSGFQVTFGRAKYNASIDCLVWKIRKFPGQTETSMSADVELISTMTEKKSWTRPAIQMEFQVPMFTASGLWVRFLKVWEKSGYNTVEWIRYITKAGSYEICAKLSCRGKRRAVGKRGKDHVCKSDSWWVQLFDLIPESSPPTAPSLPHIIPVIVAEASLMWFSAINQ